MYKKRKFIKLRIEQSPQKEIFNTFYKRSSSPNKSLLLVQHHERESQKLIEPEKVINRNSSLQVMESQKLLISNSELKTSKQEIKKENRKNFIIRNTISEIPKDQSGLTKTDSKVKNSNQNQKLESPSSMYGYQNVQSTNDEESKAVIKLKNDSVPNRDSINKYLMSSKDQTTMKNLSKDSRLDLNNENIELRVQVVESNKAKSSIKSDSYREPPPKKSNNSSHHSSILGGFDLSVIGGKISDAFGFGKEKVVNVIGKNSQTKKRQPYIKQPFLAQQQLNQMILNMKMNDQIINQDQQQKERSFILQSINRSIPYINKSDHSRQVLMEMITLKRLLEQADSSKLYVNQLNTLINHFDHTKGDILNSFFQQLQKIFLENSRVTTQLLVIRAIMQKDNRDSPAVKPTFNSQTSEENSTNIHQKNLGLNPNLLRKNERDHFDEDDLSDSCISINNKSGSTKKQTEKSNEEDNKSSNLKDIIQKQNQFAYITFQERKQDSQQSSSSQQKSNSEIVTKIDQSLNKIKINSLIEKQEADKPYEDIKSDQLDQSEQMKSLRNIVNRNKELQQKVKIVQKLPIPFIREQHSNSVIDFSVDMSKLVSRPTSSRKNSAQKELNTESSIVKRQIQSIQKSPADSQQATQATSPSKISINSSQKKQASTIQNQQFSIKQLNSEVQKNVDQQILRADQKIDQELEKRKKQYEQRQQMYFYELCEFKKSIAQYPQTSNTTVSTLDSSRQLQQQVKHFDKNIFTANGSKKKFNIHIAGGKNFPLSKAEFEVINERTEQEDNSEEDKGSNSSNRTASNSSRSAGGGVTLHSNTPNLSQKPPIQPERRQKSKQQSISSLKDLDTPKFKNNSTLLSLNQKSESMEFKDVYN
ncbi:UNKNOWN [Stylonychia lemnae]|uniref:Uncharacterized protein n=1 Tax=Stylonychia lemnae TaxID=5949 RepID=A0A078AQ46_STYLE|nr:UNKNOWN [Stylonychia lemnae]|eukprot:CDW83068.1 UNKNOWN [Stylonychia lemnae]